MLKAAIETYGPATALLSSPVTRTGWIIGTAFRFKGLMTHHDHTQEKEVVQEWLGKRDSRKDLGRSRTLRYKMLCKLWDRLLRNEEDAIAIGAGGTEGTDTSGKHSGSRDEGIWGLYRTV